MRTIILASGSKGNATLFESTARHGRTTRVLVDAGLSLRALRKRLRALGEEERLDAIVVTHAHRDHVGHSRKLAAAFSAPLYMSESTARYTGYDAKEYSPREPFEIGALTLTPTPLPHDAAQVALTLDDGTIKAALCTDLGEVPPALPDVLRGVDLLLLEANYDLQMLRDGPYPYAVKRRIASAGGHLSNEQTAELLRDLRTSLSRVVLMHLSETNNRPDIARAVCAEALAGSRATLELATQHEPLVLEPRPRTRIAPFRQEALVRSAQLSFAF